MYACQQQSDEQLSCMNRETNETVSLFYYTFENIQDFVSETKC